MPAASLRALAVTVAVVTVGTVAVVAGAVVQSEDGQRASVVRVVDGDTLVVDYDHAQHKIRLLNVDTPETVDPDEPVQCLGPEATTFLKQRLPVGTDVMLEFDEDRSDRYGRELAGVFEGKSLVNAEIARSGLGVAVLFEPNRRFYQKVLDAQHDAEQHERGLYSPTSECTLPARVADLERAAAALALADGASLAVIDRHAATVAALTATKRVVEDLLRVPAHGYPATAYPDRLRDQLAHRVAVTSTALDEADDALTAARAAAEERAAARQEAARARRAAELAEKRAVARREARAEREAAQRKAAARQAAEEQAAERRAEERRAAQRRAAAERRAAETRPDEDGVDPSQRSSGAPDAYTGCRAYGPGGTSVDNKGRRYTKIAC